MTLKDLQSVYDDHIVVYEWKDEVYKVLYDDLLTYLTNEELLNKEIIIFHNIRKNIKKAYVIQGSDNLEDLKKGELKQWKR